MPLEMTSKAMDVLSARLLSKPQILRLRLSALRFAQDDKFVQVGRNACSSDCGLLLG